MAVIKRPLVALVPVEKCKPTITFSNTESSLKRRMFWKVRAIPILQIEWALLLVISTPR